MTLKRLISDLKETLITEQRKFEKLLREAPSGTLVYSKTTVKGKAYYKWYVSIRDNTGQRKKFYISRKNRKLACELAQKRLRQKRLKEIRSQLLAIDAFLLKYIDNSVLNDLLDTPLLECLVAETPDFEAIDHDMDLSEELKKWAEEPYEMNPSYPELKNVPTVDKIMVRSKSEALIVMLLSAMHIPYRYEFKLELGGHIFYPDFTIRHPVTGKFYYWEHIGMLDSPEYIADFLQKIRIYINNGLYPDHNLILTFESGGHPFDITIAQDKIREFFSCEMVDLY